MDDISIVMKVDSAPVDRAVRVMDNLEAELRDVDRAMSKNLITEKQYNAETKRLRQSMDRLRVVSKGSAKDFRAFEKTVYGSGKAMRQKEIAMQQAGYQLQDFIVQVQAGTNPLIAFSQQGSQLAGFFAGPWGAAIGLGIAALGGLGTALLGTRSKAKSLEETVEDLTDAFDAYVETMEESTLEQVNGKFQTQTNLLVAIQRELNQIAKIKAMEALDKATVELNQKMDGFWGRLSNIKTFLEKKGWFAELDKGVAQFNGNLLHMIDNANALDSRLESALDIKQMLLDNVGPYNQMTDAQRAFYDMLIKVIQRMEQAKALTEQGGTGAAALEPFGGAGEDNDYLAEVNKVINEENQRRRALYKESMKEAVRINNNRYQREQNEINKVEAVRQARFKVSIQNATKLSDDARQLAEDRETVSIALQAAFRKRTTDAQQTAADNYHNAMIARQRAYYDNERKLAKEAFENALTVLNVAHTPSMIATLAKYAGRGTVDDSDPIFGSTGKSIYDEPEVTDFQRAMEKYKDFVSDLQLEERISRELVDVFGSERDIQEELIRLKHEYAILGKQFDEEEIERILRKIEANEQYRQKLEEAKQKQEELADMIGTKFEDAMMSIVDGTKSVEDAFKQMAGEIIKELYRVLVVQEMVAAFKMGMKAMGGGGSFLSGFFGGFMADGGQVSNNKAYVVGEEGPEVFMPRSNGTIIPNDKLNTGGNVTVVQHLNISTGVQQTVRSEIRQLMPQIAENAKAAVVDSKRRGGNYGKAFA